MPYMFNPSASPRPTSPDAGAAAREASTDLPGRATRRGGGGPVRIPRQPHPPPAPEHPDGGQWNHHLLARWLETRYQHRTEGVGARRQAARLAVEEQEHYPPRYNPAWPGDTPARLRDAAADRRLTRENLERHNRFYQREPERARAREPREARIPQSARQAAADDAALASAFSEMGMGAPQANLSVARARPVDRETEAPPNTPESSTPSLVHDTPPTAPGDVPPRPSDQPFQPWGPPRPAVQHYYPRQPRRAPVAQYPPRVLSRPLGVHPFVPTPPRRCICGFDPGNPNSRCACGGAVLQQDLP
ncbi:hypothetical protein FKP32DRAFT_1680059 [Trametes sanguinea]|nr:hypothetical protein FKP32DRAFT_1680059 [Trametes sanguinea]